MHERACRAATEVPRAEPELSKALRVLEGRKLGPWGYEARNLQNKKPTWRPKAAIPSLVILVVVAAGYWGWRNHDSAGSRGAAETGAKARQSAANAVPVHVTSVAKR